ncbi:tetratricopeptide repeat protein [Desulfovibrio sp. TomC]|uniref:tetratricopeptide repeat protein n=1 Tax=Desulfovibrio sp. TomC TaxID=1562888 RepID=UPI000575577A|nr:VWA domain-containing protein [Desulfovibrio sp. TomC]KHK00860.1 von Willebrand factor, type A [Desulfovibrio sp. TomC]
MTFARPQWLWLLAAVAVCLVCALLARARRRSIAAAYPTLAASPGRRGLKSLCFLLGLTAIALAAAGPRFGFPEGPATMNPSPRLRLIIALDCSRSMLARDLAPNRLGAAKALVLDVLTRLPAVEAGLVGFAGRSWLACPVTPDRSALALFLDALSPDAAPLGGTDLATALEAARLALGGTRPGMILLVSDGEGTASPESDRPVNDVPVFTVAVGSALPAPVPGADGTPLRTKAGAPVAAGVDVAGLAELARQSGGAAFRLSPEIPSPAKALADALIARGRQEAAAAATGPIALDARSGDESGLFLAAGIALLLCDMLLAPVAGRLLPVLALIVLAAGPALAASSAAEKTGQGLTAYARGDYPAARAAFLAARARDPDDPTILYDIGATSYRQGRFTDAHAAFDRAAGLAAPPLAAKARYNQGNAAYRLGDVPGALAAYEAALALDPNDADARANLDWLRANPTPPTPPKTGDKPDERRPGQSPDGQNDPAQAQSGQAPSPQGTDDGSGQQTAPDQPPQPGPPPDMADPAKTQEAHVPVAGPDGEKGGPRRANSPGAADDPILDRIPDLPGLPVAPVYGRPTVEKDW